MNCTYSAKNSSLTSKDFTQKKIIKLKNAEEGFNRNSSGNIAIKTQE
jgi:hypothetical protein